MIYVVDTETTGEKPPDAAVCEIAAVPVTLDGKVVLSKVLDSLVNPGHSMPAAARAVHHLGDVDLKSAKPYKQVMRRMFSHLNGAIVAAHNMAFDWQFLEPELTDVRQICTMKCAMTLYPDAPNHKNQTLRYHLGCEPPASALKGLAPHRARYDAVCTAFILARMLRDAGGYERLIEISSQPVLLKTCYLKAHKGKPWAEVPADYLRWILRTPDFNEDVIHTARHYLGMNVVTINPPAA